MDRKSFYYPIGGSYSKRDFSEICESQKSKSSRYEIKKECLETIQKYKTLLESLNKGHELSLEMIRTAITHDTQDEELSFLGIWENTIERLKVENNGARVTEKEMRVRTSAENSNIQDRVIKICSEILGWEVRPSGTWCRHSFATNLTHAGVERKYITESMGHSTSHSITDMYIAAYPLDTQFEYNSRLLNLGNEKETVPTKDRIDKMTEQEAKELLLKLLGTK